VVPGSVVDRWGLFSPGLTLPERFIFAGRSAAAGNPWDYLEGQDPPSDGAVLYYWG